MALIEWRMGQKTLDTCTFKDGSEMEKGRRYGMLMYMNDSNTDITLGVLDMFLKYFCLELLCQFFYFFFNMTFTK